MANTIIELANLWGLVGFAVVLSFVLVGIDRVDASARGAWVFRPLIVPGVILLWPVVVWRWVALERGAAGWRHRHSPTRGVHAPAWLILAVVIPLTLVLALGARQVWPADTAPVQLTGPEAAP